MQQETHHTGAHRRGDLACTQLTIEFSKTDDHRPEPAATGAFLAARRAQNDCRGADVGRVHPKTFAFGECAVEHLVERGLGTGNRVADIVATQDRLVEEAQIAGTHRHLEG